MPRYSVEIDNQEFDIQLEYRSERFFATVNGHPFEVQHQWLGESRALLFIGAESLEVDIHSVGGNGQRMIFMKGIEIPAFIEDHAVAKMRKAAGISHHVAADSSLKAPMPGLVIKLRVEPGERVAKGQPLVIIEAMKMENIIKARTDGIIKEIKVKAGQSVEKGDTLLEFE
ncbi:MAG: biotin/lipoyl-binding protein [bacterium]|nr:biotin/lipoyl-binding protein [bacterium]